MRMETRVWFITGASRGIGAEIAKAALDAGHRVVATGRQADSITKALGTSANLLAVSLDVTQEQQAAAAVQAAVERFGRIDVLVNNAGYGQLGFFESISAEQISNQFATNVFGCMHVTRAVLPMMRKQRSGYVFSISSISGIIGDPGASISCASKFAVEGWMECLRLELERFGITAILIEPGFFSTDFLDNSSVSYGDIQIEEYAAWSADTRAALDARNHQQLGDPAKLGAAMLTLIEAERHRCVSRQAQILWGGCSTRRSNSAPKARHGAICPSRRTAPSDTKAEGIVPHIPTPLDARVFHEALDSDTPPGSAAARSSISLLWRGTGATTAIPSMPFRNPLSQASRNGSRPNLRNSASTSPRSNQAFPN